MFKNLYNSIKKKYRKIRVYTRPHQLYSTFDRVKLSKIERGNSKKGFIKLNLNGLGHSIKIRKNYIDKEVVGYVFADQYHLPPKEVILPKNPVILDLGSNIGLTVVHLKKVYPDATIYAYEMNTENYLLAKYNTKSYDGVYLHNEAIWIENSVVSYSPSSDFDAYSIKDNADDNNSIKINSTTISKIIETYNLSKIDFVKMDIEGAEEDVLKNQDLSWLHIVNALNIEMHLDEGEHIEPYLKILEKYGFKAWKDTKHWSSIMAVKG
jgi:FkbM family methyltransferase